MDFYGRQELGGWQPHSRPAPRTTARGPGRRDRLCMPGRARPGHGLQCPSPCTRDCKAEQAARPCSADLASALKSHAACRHSACAERSRAGRGGRGPAKLKGPPRCTALHETETLVSESSWLLQDAGISPQRVTAAMGLGQAEPVQQSRAVCCTTPATGSTPGTIENE